MNKRMLFITAAAILLIAGIYARYDNEKHAKTLVSAVESSDLMSTSTQTPVSALQLYVKEHMGASVRYTLTGSYDRAVASANAAAAAQGGDGSIYAAAQAACSGKTDSITQAKCNQAYLSAHLANVAPATLVLQPKLASYQYSLKSPSWTPDLAGSILLGALIAFIMGIVTKSGVHSK
jgi:hypothetical protein